ncbi:MAG TPA: hypothetical protein VF316_05520 [Polyangiaceae bacterium]
MSKASAALLAFSTLALAACSSVSVESEARLPQPVPAFARTLVVVALPDAARRVAEDTLVARLASLHPSASYPTVALENGVTLGALRERARKEGFDGLLVVWPNGITQRDYPGLAGDTPLGIPPSTEFGLCFVASLTALDGDLEIWKGIATNRDPFPIVRHARETMTALAARMRTDSLVK